MKTQNTSKHFQPFDLLGDCENFAEGSLRALSEDSFTNCVCAGRVPLLGARVRLQLQQQLRQGRRGLLLRPPARTDSQVRS